MTDVTQLTEDVNRPQPDEGTPSPEPAAPAPEGPPSDTTPEIQQAMDDAARLEQANQRIRELEALTTPEALKGEAEKLLLEVMPEYGEALANWQNQQQQQPPWPQQQPPPQQAWEREPWARPEQPPQQFTSEEEVEADLHQELAQLKQAFFNLQEEMAINYEQQRLSDELDRLQAKYPMMDRKTIINQIQAQPGQVRLNLEALARMNQDHRTAEFEAYHQQKLRNAPQPPRVPTQPAEAPSEQVTPKTFGDAKHLFAERFKALFGQKD